MDYFAIGLLIGSLVTLFILQGILSYAKYILGEAHKIKKDATKNHLEILHDIAEIKKLIAMKKSNAL